MAYMSLGQHLLQHLKEALIMQEWHQQLFVQFSKTFAPETLVSWQKSIDAWRIDRTKPNPYMDPGPSKLMTYYKKDDQY